MTGRLAGLADGIRHRAGGEGASPFARLRMFRPLRLAALGATALVIGSFVGVLYHVVDVISEPGTFQLIVGVTLVGTTVLARYLSVRRALVVAGVLLVGGLGWYLAHIDSVSLWLLPHLRYTLALMTGQSVLTIANLEAWVLAITPAPVFLTWYLALRRRYVVSAGVGGATTLFFVLSGDAGPELALLGVVGVVALVGFGELDAVDATVGDADIVAAIVALTILLSATVTVVPAGMGYTFSPETGFGQSGSGTAGTPDTVEANLLNADDEFSIQGSLELSSSVRYRVRSTDAEYWRVGSYDLYTGDGWTRRGQRGPLDRRLGTPAGRSRTVEQTYRPLTDTNTMPAVWRPTAVSGSPADSARVSSLGGLVPTRTILGGETYSVESSIPVATLSELRTAGRDYPDAIQERYLQLPESTPDRVAERTQRLTANAETPYDTARVIETWLETNRAYSLNVSQPSGSVADSFLFEMQRGYCTYYATTMAVMLRSQDIPARMVVGYTPGQRVSENEWVVRGQNAHAWVEVYFPEIGWIQFDPTPAGPRETTEESDLEAARENDVPNVDTNDSEGGEWTPTPSETPERTAIERANETVNAPLLRGERMPGSATLTANPDTQPPADNGDSNGGASGLTVQLPTAEQATLGLLAVLGLAGIARRTGVSRRARRAFHLRWQPRADPETDLERAFDRLSSLLAHRHRERRDGETVRAYLDAIEADERARRVAERRERARYEGTVSETAAEEAVTLVDELVRE